MSWFKKPSQEELLKAELAKTESDLLDAERAVEYHQAMRDMLLRRKSRLVASLK